MLAKVLSGAILGIDAYVVEVEVDIVQGLPGFRHRGPAGWGGQRVQGAGKVGYRKFRV